MITRALVVVAITLVAAQSPTAAGGPPLPNHYVLSQAYCFPPQATTPGTCRPQAVPIGATMEIQLPGTPSVWKVAGGASVSAALRAEGVKKLASPGRIAGTSEIYVFTFKAMKAGSAEVVFQETPAHMSKPGGTFTFPITVK